MLTMPRLQVAVVSRWQVSTLDTEKTKRGGEERRRERKRRDDFDGWESVAVKGDRSLKRLAAVDRCHRAVHRCMGSGANIARCPGHTS